MSRKWIDVKDSLPEDDRYVLLLVKWCDDPVIARRFNGSWQVSQECLEVWGDAIVVTEDSVQRDAVCWHPLPELPLRIAELTGEFY